MCDHDSSELNIGFDLHSMKLRDGVLIAAFDQSLTVCMGVAT
jgi:hypothetical protein